MQFSRAANVFRVSRITGPSHNLLGLEFRDSGTECEVVVESLPSTATAPQALTADDVRMHVDQGVTEANRELRANYIVKRIQFVPADTPPAEVYRFLAYSIIERLTKGTSFEGRD